MTVPKLPNPLTPPPAPRPGAWRFGTPYDRANGGIQLRLMWDHVLPYSIPPVDSPTNDWFRRTLPDGTTPQPGEFPGYERNMAESGGSAPNYPHSGDRNRHFNAVFITTLGLTEAPVSGTGAWTPDPRPEGKTNYTLDGTKYGDLVDWPFAADTSTGHAWSGTRPRASEVFRTYFKYYLDTETYYIPQFCKRDVMAWLSEDDDTHDLADIAISHFMAFFLHPQNVDPAGRPISDRLIAWNPIHEPEIGGTDAQGHVWGNRSVIHVPGEINYDTGQLWKHNLADLRNRIRELEQYFRDYYDTAFPSLSTGYSLLSPGEPGAEDGDLGEGDQQRLLRPVMITFSAAFNDDVRDKYGFPPGNTPDKYVDCADVFFFDRDCWKRSWWTDTIHDYINEPDAEQEGLRFTTRRSTPRSRSAETIRTIPRRWWSTGMIRSSGGSTTRPLPQGIRNSPHLAGCL